jgi:hypothetical protein
MAETNKTIDDLLKSLRKPAENVTSLINSADTWERIGNKDSFDELNLSKTELESFLSEWKQANPYSNI